MLLCSSLIIVEAEKNCLNYDIDSYLKECDYVHIYSNPYSYIIGKYGDFDGVVYDNVISTHLYREEKGDLIDALVERLCCAKLLPLSEKTLNIDDTLMLNEELLMLEFVNSEPSILERATWIISGNDVSLSIRINGESKAYYYNLKDCTELTTYVLRLAMIESKEQRALVNYDGAISKMHPFLIDGIPQVSIQQIGDFLGNVITTGKNNCDLYEIYNGLGYGEMWSESQWWNLLYMDRTKGMYNLYEILDKYGYSVKWDECKWCFFVEKKIAVMLNGFAIELEHNPYIKQDRTMVPMRAIFEALGAEVSWDDATKTAIGVKDNNEVKITIGENVLYKNGEAIELDCAAEITNDRTMVPVRAISEAFGCTVTWNDETKTVEITN